MSKRFVISIVLTYLVVGLIGGLFLHKAYTDHKTSWKDVCDLYLEIKKENTESEHKWFIEAIQSAHTQGWLDCRVYYR